MLNNISALAPIFDPGQGHQTHFAGILHGRERPCLSMEFQSGLDAPPYCLGLAVGIEMTLPSGMMMSPGF